MCPPGYHHNSFMATHALGHMMYGYILLILSQRVLNKLSKKYHISGHKWSTTYRMLNSHRSKIMLIFTIYYTHLVSVRFEQSLCCGSLITTYFAHPLACWALFGSLVSAMFNRTAQHVLKCMSCLKAGITRNAHYIYIYIYIKKPLCNLKCLILIEK